MSPPDAHAPPLVSVVLPCRDEAPHLERCLDSVLATTYPRDRLEILVVDGLSTDGSAALARRYAASHAGVRVLDNPRQRIPSALNIGIAAARGDVIVRVDGHSSYAPGYIPRLVRALEEFHAGNVGGVLDILPQEDTPFGLAIAAVLGHPFIAGRARYRTGVKAPVDADTVPFGCYPRRVFTAVGGFDERFLRNEDFEFNQRLRRAGWRVVLVPDAQSWYHARSRPGAVCRQYFQNGRSIVAPLGFGVAAFAWRHLAPLALVTFLLAAAALAAFSTRVRPWAAAAVGAYVLTALLAAADVCWHRRNGAIYLHVLTVFALMHLSFGLGSLVASLAVLWRPAAWRALLGN